MAHLEFTTFGPFGVSLWKARIYSDGAIVHFGRYTFCLKVAR